MHKVSAWRTDSKYNSTAAKIATSTQAQVSNKLNNSYQEQAENYQWTILDSSQLLRKAIAQRAALAIRQISEWRFIRFTVPRLFGYFDEVSAALGACIQENADLTILTQAENLGKV